MWLLAVVLWISLGSKQKQQGVESGAFLIYLIWVKILQPPPVWQLQTYSRSTRSAISNISLCRLSSPFNSLPSIVQLCQACQRADLLLFCLIHCNDSVYKESEEPPTHTMLIFTLRATVAESINANRTVACLFKRRTRRRLAQLIGWSAAPRRERQRLCLDASP